MELQQGEASGDSHVEGVLSLHSQVPDHVGSFTGGVRDISSQYSNARERSVHRTFALNMTSIRVSFL